MFWKNKYDRQLEDLVLNNSRYWKYSRLVKIVTWVVLLLSLIYMWEIVAIVCGLLLYFTSRSWCLQVCELKQKE
jgi:hypothetical protein